MKLTSTLGLIVFTMGLVGLAVTQADATIVVPTDQPTIQAAINAAVPGEDIIVLAGNYPEGQIDVTTPVQIYGPNFSVYPPTARNPEAHVTGGFVISVSNVTIQGLEIEGGAGSPSRCISGMQALSNINVSYNWLHSPTGTFSTAIDLGDYGGARSQNIEVDANTIDNQIPGSSQGITIQAADNVTVVGNSITLATSLVSGSEYGFPCVVFDGVHGGLIGKNTLDAGLTSTNIYPGGAIYSVGVQATVDDIIDVQITHNQMVNCAAGVLSSSGQFGVYNVSVVKNVIDSYFVGIFLQGFNIAGPIPFSHSGFSINQNDITAATACVYVRGGSSWPIADVILRKNCLLAKTGSTGVWGVLVAPGAIISTHGNSIDARLNYWDAASGPSGTGPGTGVKASTRVDFAKWLRDCPH